MAIMRGCRSCLYVSLHTRQTRGCIANYGFHEQNQLENGRGLRLFKFPFSCCSFYQNHLEQMKPHMQ